MKTKRKKIYRTVSVRFIGKTQIYICRAPAKTKILLGDLLYVETCHGG